MGCAPDGGLVTVQFVPELAEILDKFGLFFNGGSNNNQVGACCIYLPGTFYRCDSTPDDQGQGDLFSDGTDHIQSHRV